MRKSNLNMDTSIVIVLIIVILFTNLIRSEGDDQTFVIEPSNVSALQGSTVVLPCKVSDKKGVLQWTRDDFGLGTHRNLSAFETYEMIGTDSDGDYSLQIENVTLDDEGQFQCQVGPGADGSPGIRSRYATLKVLVIPDPPKIIQGEFLLIDEGQPIQLECVSSGGRPATKLIWMNGSGKVITEGIETINSSISDETPKLFITRSKIKFMPSKQHHNTTLACESEKLLDEVQKRAEIKIEVKYIPRVTVTLLKVAQENRPKSLASYLSEDASSEYKDSDEYGRPASKVYSENSVDLTEGSGDYVREYSEARFQCVADSFPESLTYKWFINNELVVGDYTTEMVIHNTTRKLNGAKIKCEATNEQGTGEGDYVTKVTYAPIFLEPLKSIEADVGESAHLECNVDGNPLEIVWVHDPIDRFNYHPSVVGSNSELNIKVTEETAGRYFCKANVNGYPEIKTDATVYVKQKPHITSQSLQYGRKGDTLRLECSARSVPKARHISWSFNGREINTNADRNYSILEDPQSHGIKSVLVIRDSGEWHFGKYNCTVVNDYGVDVQQIELLEQRIFLGKLLAENLNILIIVGAISLLVILLTVALAIYNLKRNSDSGGNDNSLNKREYGTDLYAEKPTKMSEKCWQESDGSSHSSDYKPDIKSTSTASEYSESTIDIKDFKRGDSVPLAETVPINYPQSEYVDTDKYYYATKIGNAGHNNYGYATTLTDYPRTRYTNDPLAKYEIHRAVPTSTVLAMNRSSWQEVGGPNMQTIGLQTGTRSSLIV